MISHLKLPKHPSIRAEHYSANRMRVVDRSKTSGFPSSRHAQRRTPKKIFRYALHAFWEMEYALWMNHKPPMSRVGQPAVARDSCFDPLNIQIFSSLKSNIP